MKATELRIGSWVTHPAAVWSHRSESQGYGHVDFQWEEKDWLGVAECTINLEDVKPIPLTEEWLERLGFENYSMNLDEDGFTHVDVSFLSGGVEVYINDMIYPHIKHVHQLQNLYFALTGEELQTDETDQKVNQ